MKRRANADAGPRSHHPPPAMSKLWQDVTSVLDCHGLAPGHGSPDLDSLLQTASLEVVNCGETEYMPQR